MRRKFDVIIPAVQRASRVTSSLQLVLGRSSSRHFLFIVNRRVSVGAGKRLESIAAAVTRSSSSSSSSAFVSSAPGDVNWNEPDCRRDYADAATAELEELAFMRLVRTLASRRRAGGDELLNRKERPAVGQSRIAATRTSRRR